MARVKVSVQTQPEAVEHKNYSDSLCSLLWKVLSQLKQYLPRLTPLVPLHDVMSFVCQLGVALTAV